MKTFIITREHLDADNNYIGEDLENFDGILEVEENLGDIKFEYRIKVNGYILFKAGSGIKTRGGIEARANIMVLDGNIEAEGYINSNADIKVGGYIKSPLKISASYSIYAGRFIDVHEIFAGIDIEAKESIRVKWGIRSRSNIKVGSFIEAKEYIIADYDIIAGESIKSGLIHAGRGNIEAGSNILAEENIECGGDIKAGQLIEAGYSINTRYGIEAGTAIKAGWGITAGTYIKAGAGIEAEFIFSSDFDVSAKTLKTRRLPFSGKYYSQMSGMEKFKELIEKNDAGWDVLKSTLKKESEYIIGLPCWHPLIKAQIKMYLDEETEIQWEDGK